MDERRLLAISSQEARRSSSAEGKFDSQLQYSLDQQGMNTHNMGSCTEVRGELCEIGCNEDGLTCSLVAYGRHRARCGYMVRTIRCLRFCIGDEGYIL